MYKRILILLLLTAKISVSYAQTSQPNVSVFGYKLGEKLVIPECPCKIAEAKVQGNHGLLSQKSYKGYAYLDAAPNITCFKRADIGKYTVRKSEELKPLPPVYFGLISVIFANTDAPSPSMCPSGEFAAAIEDSKLTFVRFSIKTADADEVFETLKKKYGTNVLVKPFKVQNGYGATLEYYTATWAFKNLHIVLESSFHTSISDLFGSVTIQIPKKTTSTSKNQREL